MQSARRARSRPGAGGAAVCLATVFAGALGCGTAGSPRGAEPAVGAGPFPGGPPPPTQGLALPSLDVDWEPTRSVAGDLAELVSVLSDRGSAGALQLSLPAPWLMPPLDGVSVADALADLAPGSAWHPPKAGGLVGAGLSVPPPQPASTTVSGPTRDAATVVVDGDALKRHGAGAHLVVAIDTAPMSLAQWRAQPRWSVGGCDEVTAALAAGQEHGLTEVEPFVAHLDALLLQVYRPAVAAMAPRWLDELSPYVDTEPPSPELAERHACGRAYLAHVRAVAACARAEDPDCSIAPKSYLRGGLRIGLPSVDGGSPGPQCAKFIGHDYVAASRRLALEAAQAIDGALDRRWLQLASRVGALSEVHAAVAEMCRPQRRRFDPEDLVEAQRRLTAIGDRLASGLTRTASGRFVAATDALVVAGAEPVTAVADFDGGPGSQATRARAEARALARWLAGRARCRGEQDSLPLAVVTADPASGAAVSLTYVYPEALSCGDLGGAL